ncbi:RES domain-containing protein [Pseudomonas marginalis]|uniref:RES domain-containing protein n=1 Tax=Pseudomonas marginalis TaxID=298 RepID=UPI0020339542|nr:RES domain-containing protein [Pseudomonas marginalis]MCM2376948.1 RES domain-containing protein [Pseudomonas marginalis]
METITEQFPPLELGLLQEKINNFAKFSLVEKHSFISELVRAHPLLSMEFTAGSIFRRARKIGRGDYPSSVQDLLWRVLDVPSVGRANPEGFPVLYVADRPETAFSETHVRDDYILLSELRIRNGAKCRIAPIGEMLQIQRTGRGFLSGDGSPTIDKMLNVCERREVQSLLIADAFLFECLVEDDDRYLISSFVAKEVFEKNRSISAVAFPSVRQHGAINFAIRTEDFWNSWGVFAARRMHVHHLACGYYDTQQTEHVVEIGSGGALVWEKGVVENNVARAFQPPWHPNMRSDLES